MPERMLEDVHGNQRLLFFNKDTPFSNFYPCTIIADDGERFNCAEQFYQAHKAKFLGDYVTLQHIKAARDGRQAKVAAKPLRLVITPEWDNIKGDILHDVVLSKFSQNAHLAQRLIATGACFMVEANPHDAYFGSGLSIDDPKHKDPTLYRGQNVMGQILEQIRDRLRPSLPVNPDCRSVLLCPSL